MKRMLAVGSAGTALIFGIVAWIGTMGRAQESAVARATRPATPFAVAMPTASEAVHVASVAPPLAIPVPSAAPARPAPSPPPLEPQGLTEADEDIPSDTPEAAFARMQYGILGRDLDLLRSSVTGLDDDGLRDLTENGRMFLVARVKSSRVLGEEATLTITVEKQGDATIRATRAGRQWRIHMDRNAGRDEAVRRDCTNNLKQIGLYLNLYVSKYGNDRDWPGPGMRLLTALFTDPSPERAVCGGGLGLLECKACGDRVVREKVLRGDLDCASYECIERRLDAATSPDTPIVWDRRPNHDGKRNVLLFSGTVLTMTEEEFRTSRLKR